MMMMTMMGMGNESFFLQRQTRNKVFIISLLAIARKEGRKSVA